MTAGITSMAAMSRQELETALQRAYEQHQATQGELLNEQQLLQTALLRLNGVSLALHDMTEALTGLLVLHIERKPVEVYERLNVLAKRYVRSVSAQDSCGSASLDVVAHAARKVH